MTVMCVQIMFVGRRVELRLDRKKHFREQQQTEPFVRQQSVLVRSFCASQGHRSSDGLYSIIVTVLIA